MSKLAIILMMGMLACESKDGSEIGESPIGSCLTGSSLLCTQQLPQKERQTISLACTEGTSVTEDGDSVVDMECAIPEKDPNVDTDFTVGFTTLPQYQTFEVDTAQVSDAFTLEKSADPKFAAQTYPLRYGSDETTARFRYKALVQKSLEEACRSATMENNTFHEQAKSLDKSCSVTSDCTEVSRLAENIGCLTDTVAFRTDPNSPDKNKFGALLFYCSSKLTGSGSSYCESGENPPREHHTVCRNNKCEVTY